MQMETVQSPYGEIRFFWIRLTFGLTAFLGILVGGIMMFGPEKLARKVVGIPFVAPEQDPIFFGALGGIWLTVGIMSAMALRAPLKFLPVLMLQFVYKLFWFLCVFFPLMWRGEFPDYGWASVIGNAFWMILDIKAVPWGFIFAEDRPDALDPLPPKEATAAQPSQAVGAM